MEELYSYHVYYGKHLSYGIYDDDLLKSLIHQDMTLYRLIFNEIKEEMDANFDPFLHLVSRRYLEDNLENVEIIFNVFNPGLLTVETVEKLREEKINERIEIILSTVLIYLERAILKLVNDSILDLFILSPSLWQIFVVKLYKELIPVPKYKHYLSNFIDLATWGL